MTLKIHKLNAKAADFRSKLQQALAWENLSDTSVATRVQEILADVRLRGDAAVLHWTNTFDKLNATNCEQLKIAPARLQQVFDPVIAQFGNMVEVGPWGLRITPEGRPLARMVANMMDSYMAAPTSHSSAV